MSKIKKRDTLEISGIVNEKEIKSQIVVFPILKAKTAGGAVSGWFKILEREGAPSL